MYDELQQYIEQNGGQQAVANRWGVSQATISRWVSGKLRIKPKRVSQISDDTGIPREKLRPDVFD